MTLASPRCAQQRRVGDLQLVWNEYDGGSRMPVHAHDNPRLVFVLDGRFAETCSGRQRICESRTLLLRPAGEIHSEDFRYGRAACLSVDLPARWLGRSTGTEPPVRSAQLRTAGIARIASTLRREMPRTDPASAFAIEAAVLDALVETMRDEPVPAPARAEPRWISRVEAILHERFAEPLHLSQVADAVNLHPVHVARMFRRYRGTSVGEYLRVRRVEYARHALRTSDAPLAEIASRAGFADQSHFSHLFKRATGFTPGRFRREHGRR